MNIDLLELIKGRKIAIIGGYDFHDNINRYDLIVRINSHWERQAGRCHIVYHNGSRRDWHCMRSKFRDIPGLKQIKFMSIAYSGGSRQEMIDFCLKHNISYMTYRKDLRRSTATPWARELVSRLQAMTEWPGGEPFTGTLAAWHISKYPVQELLITVTIFFF